MTDAVHRVRNSLLSRERGYSLGPDALQWREDGDEGRLAYRNIVRIQLIRYPGADGMHGQCTVRGRDGRKLVVRAQHYVSLGHFEARPASYRALVAGLCRHVAAANPQAAFVLGNIGIWILWIVVLVLCVLAVFMVLAVLLDSAGRQLGAWSGLIALAVLAPFAWRMIRTSKAVPFDPDSPPV